MQQCKHRNVYEHFLTSETSNSCDVVIKRSYLVRQFHFKNKNNFTKDDPVPRHTRTMRVTLELLQWNGELCLIVNCDCG